EKASLKDIQSTGILVPLLPSHVNSEDEGALAKLVEAIGTNYKDRHNEICGH
ncbi:60S ribosomal protein L7A, partial [Saguinus oedipus]